MVGEARGEAGSGAADCTADHCSGMERGILAFRFSVLRLAKYMEIIYIQPSTEEIVFRGLIQTYLSSRITSSFSLLRFRISHAAMVSALLFSLARLLLLTKGAGAAQVTMIEISTFILGLAAGYFRETTGSLVPAVIIHMFFNIWGTGLQLLVTVAP